jgi:hypothetical protein
MGCKAKMLQEDPGECERDGEGAAWEVREK